MPELYMKKTHVPDAHVIEEIESQGRLEEDVQLEAARPSLRVYRTDVREEYEEYQRRYDKHLKECEELFGGDVE